jgi:ABC-type uncharacterized transport system permease subunit
MTDFLIAVLVAGTPLVYVAMAGMLAQRTGVWNLGLEGLMVIGACASVVGTKMTDSVALGVLLAAAMCVVASIFLWVAVEVLKANPIIAGLGLTGLGLGGTRLAVQTLYGSEAAVQVERGLPHLDPALGPFSALSIFAIFMPILVAALWVATRRTRFGLRLAAVGEHPFAARSVGASPARYRLVALVLGGILCALGGAELALGSLRFFSANMTAGRGYMAFSAVIFGAANPIGVAAAALFFSAVEVTGVKAQLTLAGAIPQNLILALPYIATVFGLWLSGRTGRRTRVSLAELRDY